MAIDFEKLVLDIVKPLVVYPDDVVVKVLSDDNDDSVVVQLLVNPEDLGRVIGRGGRTASAIRTILYAGATLENVRVKLDIDSY
ncbi:MAG TPA: KH domain-containing protein [Acholeplasmataceae bacterium]|jgi:predicted RNA-binding protein YlqC (UPF0109 family)|nr:KH domain-containing protein [Acholeplasmataceae bacterium]HPX72099.1 KH domain-containing protein [Acholeplasmataceae bacterium]HQC30769.1 KH domain-containing protein [Acholeplasmataceae bacterium]